MEQAHSGAQGDEDGVGDAEGGGFAVGLAPTKTGMIYCIIFDNISN